MIIRFSSVATESIIMLGETAMPLIRMMGASGSVPGAIYAADLSVALSRLHEGLHQHAARDAARTRAPAADGDDEKEQDELDLGVPLAVHALPLIDLVERANAAHVPVMWEERKVTV